MRILLIEDEAKTAGFLRRGLTENGFDVEVARDGLEGARLALMGTHDLIVLDVMLPGKSGWSIMEELRRAGQKVPVLFLTAKDSVRDRVKGLEAGADDYLVKPFAFSELIARIHSVLRRSAPQPAEPLVVGDLEIDLIRQKATRAGKRLDLTPIEFSLLSLLARRRGIPVSRAAAAKEVWDMDTQGETNVVDVHVRRLRSKMDDPFPEKLIHTVRGVGYVLDSTA